jgi:hypothetical protein
VNKLEELFILVQWCITYIFAYANNQQNITNANSVISNHLENKK